MEIFRPFGNLQKRPETPEREREPEISMLIQLNIAKVVHLTYLSVVRNDVFQSFSFS